MRSKATPFEEQLRLVTECRQSGLTDAQWCIKNGVSPSTFYNWTSRLRRKGIELPSTSEASPLNKQDIVRIDILSETSCHEMIIDSDTVELSAPVKPASCEVKEAKYSQPSMELSFGDVTLKISNEVNSALLASLMIALKEQSC